MLLSQREGTGETLVGVVCKCDIRLEEGDLPFEILLSMCLCLLFSPRHSEAMSQASEEHHVKEWRTLPWQVFIYPYTASFANLFLFVFLVLFVGGFCLLLGVCVCVVFSCHEDQNFTFCS